MKRLLTLVGVAAIATSLVPSDGQACVKSAADATGARKYNGVPIPAGTTNYQKLCDAIACVSAEWNVFTGRRLSRIKAKGNICLETGTSGAFGTSWGEGEAGTIHIALATLCDKKDATATLLHEVAHLTYTGMSSADEHCRVWFVEYKHHRERMANGPAADLPYHSGWAADIECWYPNFEAQYNNNGGMGADIPPPTPLPAEGNACRSVMASLAPPSGGTLVAHYASFGTNVLRYRHWLTGASPVVTTTDFVLGVNLIEDFALASHPANKHTIVCVGSNSGKTDGAVYAITDSDGDGVLETVSTVVGLGGGLTQPGAVVSVPQLAGPPVWFVLDVAQARIYRLADANLDGIPDGLGTVFADAALAPEIADASSLFATGGFDTEGHVTGDTVVGASSIIALHEREVSPDDWWLTFSDTDSDGVADVASRKMNADDDTVRVPIPLAGARVDDGFALLAGTKSHSVEILSKNPSTGAFDVLRGAGTFSSDHRVCVAVSPTFMPGEEYIVRDVTASIESIVFTPEGKGSAQAVGMSPTTGSSEGGEVVTITGFGFPPNPSVRFGDLYGTVLQASDDMILVETPNHGQGRRMDIDVSIENPAGHFVVAVPLTFHTGVE